MRNLSYLLKNNKPIYDCIVMNSGGKDSILLIYDLIANHKLKILSITYNDGFLNPKAEENIKNICQKFNIDSVILWRDMRKYVEKFIEHPIAKTVDLYTFTEIFQENFWRKVQEFSTAFDNIPVITGNIGYFSSEEGMPDQYNAALTYAKSEGLEILPFKGEFISYWAEENHPLQNKNLHVKRSALNALDALGWKSNDNLNTDHDFLKLKRSELNTKYPKKTLDDYIEENWEILTAPRFLKQINI